MAELKAGRVGIEIAGDAISRLALATMELNAPPKLRAESIVSILGLVEDLETIAAANVKHGTGSLRDWYTARYMRLDLMLKLASMQDSQTLAPTFHVPDSELIDAAAKRVKSLAPKQKPATNRLVTREPAVPFELGGNQLRQMLPSIFDASPLNLEAEIDEVDDEVIAKLIIARYNAAVSETDWSFIDYLAGTSHASRIADPAARLVKASIAVDQSSVRRQSLLKQFVWLRAIEEQWARAHLDNGIGTVQDLAFRSYQKLDAELDWLNGQEGATPDELNIPPMPKDEFRRAEALVQELRKQFPSLVLIDQPVEREENQETAKPQLELLRARHQVAATETAGRLLNFRSGREPLTNVVSAASRLLTSRLALADDTETQRDILNSFIKLATQLERFAQLNLESGTGTVQDLNLTKFTRLNAEVQLLKLASSS